MGLWSKLRSNSWRDAHLYYWLALLPWRTQVSTIKIRIASLPLHDVLMQWSTQKLCPGFDCSRSLLAWVTPSTSWSFSLWKFIAFMPRASGLGVALPGLGKPTPFEDVKEGIFRSLPGFNALLNECFACRLVCGDFFNGDFDFDHGCKSCFWFLYYEKKCICQRYFQNI